MNFAGSVANAFTLTRDGGGSVAFQASADNSSGVTVVTLNALHRRRNEFRLIA